MRRSGSRWAACSAVHRPTYPAPTTRRSQLTDWDSVGRSGRSRSNHIDPNALPASDRSTSAGSTYPSKTVSTRQPYRWPLRTRGGPAGRSEDVAEGVAQSAGVGDVAADRHVFAGLQLPAV